MKYISDIETNVIKTNYIVNSKDADGKDNVVNGLWFDDKNHRVMVSRNLDADNPQWCEVLTVCDIPHNENYEYNYEYEYNYNYNYNYNYTEKIEITKYEYEYIDVPVYVDKYVYEYDYEYVYVEKDCELGIDTEIIPIYSKFESNRTVYLPGSYKVDYETEGYFYEVDASFSYYTYKIEEVENPLSTERVILTTEYEKKTEILIETEICEKTEGHFSTEVTLYYDYIFTEFYKTELEKTLILPQVTLTKPFTTETDVIVTDCSYCVTTNISTTTKIETEVTVDVFQNINIPVNTELTNITGPVDVYTEIQKPLSLQAVDIKDYCVKRTIPSRTEVFNNFEACVSIDKHTYTFGELKTEVNININQNNCNLTSFVITETSSISDIVEFPFSYKTYITEFHNDLYNITDTEYLSNSKSDLGLDLGFANSQTTNGCWTMCINIGETSEKYECAQNTIDINEGDGYRLFFGVKDPVIPEGTSTEVQTEMLKNIFGKFTLLVEKTSEEFSSEYSYNYKISTGNLALSELVFSDNNQISQEYTFYLFAYGVKTTSVDEQNTEILNEQYYLTAPAPSYVIDNNIPQYRNIVENTGGYDYNCVGLQKYSEFFDNIENHLYMQSNPDIANIVPMMESRAIVSNDLYNVKRIIPYEYVKKAPDFNVITSESEGLLIEQKPYCYNDITIKGIVFNTEVSIFNLKTEISLNNVCGTVSEFTAEFKPFETEFTINIDNYYTTIPEHTELIDIKDYCGTIKKYNANFCYNYNVNIPNYKSVSVVNEKFPINIPNYKISPSAENPLTVHNYKVTIPENKITQEWVPFTTEIETVGERNFCKQFEVSGWACGTTEITFCKSYCFTTEYCYSDKITLTELLSNYITDPKFCVSTEWHTKEYTEAGYDTQYHYVYTATEFEFNIGDVEEFFSSPSHNFELYIPTGTSEIISCARIVNIPCNGSDPGEFSVEPTLEEQ